MVGWTCIRRPPNRTARAPSAFRTLASAQLRNARLIRGRARSDRRLCCVCVYVQRYEQRLPGVTVKRVLLCFLAVGRYQQASTLVEYSAFGSNQAARGPVGLFSIVWVGRAEAQSVWWQGEVLNLKSRISNRHTTGVSKKFLCVFFCFSVFPFYRDHRDKLSGSVPP